MAAGSEVVQSSNIPAYALNLLNEIAIKEGFTDYQIKSTAGSNHGDGFLGIMVRVTLEGLRKKANEIEAKADSLPLICKLPPADKVRREMFKTANAFISEIHSYDVLLPAMVKFQEERGIAKEDGFFEFPKSYGTFADPENGDFALVMEDLKAEGYDMWNKFEDLDFNHASLVMKEMGKYHALSFALRDQRPEIFAEFSKKKPVFMLEMIENEMSAKFLDNNYDMASKTLEPTEKDLYDKMQGLRTTFKSKMYELCQDQAEPFSVMNHGDFWNNNMMYLYGKGSKVPRAVCLIDWQIVQFCSPAMDISYFLFSSTDPTLRDEHYDDLLHVYYDNLAETLQRLGSDPEKLFKYSDLMDQLKKYAQYGFIMSPMLIQVVTAKPSDIPDLNELAQQIDNDKLEDFESFVKGTDPLYHRRMSGVIRFFFSKGYDL